ncbi:MAG: hypothetical protein ABIT36_11270 [Steroidobacteraceae bacterium]
MLAAAARGIERTLRGRRRQADRRDRAEKGVRPRSGYGKDRSMYALEDYTAVRHVMVRL